MGTDTHRVSRNFAVAQTVLLCAFGGAYFLDSGPRLLGPEGGAAAAGNALCAGGLLLLIAAFVSLGGAIQIAPEPREGARLVTRGVYARLRHPIYTAILLLVAGLFLRKPTVLVGIAAAVVVAFLAVKVRLEEKLLLARYPDYAGYRERTWGLVPWPRAHRR